MLKNKIYKKIINILKIVIEIKEDKMIDFILQKYNLLPKDLLKMIIEEGLTYRFNDFLEIYNNRLSFLLKFVNKDIIYIIKSYLNFEYEYIHPNIIEDYSVFIKFMKYLYIGYDLYSKNIKKYYPVYNKNNHWITLNKQSIVLYCLNSNCYRQLKYLLDNNFISNEHIKDVKENTIFFNLLYHDTISYNLIKHLL